MTPLARSRAALWCAVGIGWAGILQMFFHLALEPDASTYSSGFSPFSVVASSVGSLGGRPALVLLTIAATGVGMALAAEMPNPLLPLLLVALVGPWQGADALGLLAVLALALGLVSGPVAIAAGLLLHPVAGLIAAAWLAGRRRAEVAWVAALALILAVGLYDSFSTTYRYLIPAIILGGVKRNDLLRNRAARVGKIDLRRA